MSNTNNRSEMVSLIRNKLKSGSISIGSWIQIPNSTVSEIMGNAGYDWVAIDMEHGSISLNQLPDIFRGLELGNTLPLVRLSEGTIYNCKAVLDAGAGGVIVPMIETAEQLIGVRNASCWPPTGNRGVGFSRANLFGKYFNDYIQEAQNPLLIAMIENVRALENLDEILQVTGLDAILIGPYDLSASLNVISKFDDESFIKAINYILLKCKEYAIPVGIHVVDPNIELLKSRIKEGYQFIAYSIDSVFLNLSITNPLI